MARGVVLVRDASEGSVGAARCQQEDEKGMQARQAGVAEGEKNRATAKAVALNLAAGEAQRPFLPTMMATVLPMICMSCSSQRQGWSRVTE